MFGREIFRKSSLEKMTTPEDLDELLQVNSSRTWLMFTAIVIVLAGMLVWLFFGSISNDVKGFGIIKTLELPREIVANCTGQVDSIFVKTGDEIGPGRKLMTIFNLEDKAFTALSSPCRGEITSLNVIEGTYVQMGSPVLEMMKNNDTSVVLPEVIFFVPEEEVSRLKPGMIAELKTDKGGIPADLLRGTITFISDYPSSKTAIEKYFPDQDLSKKLNNGDFHEVRAILLVKPESLSPSEINLLHSLNGLSCHSVVTVARRSPAAYLLN
ncbi:MAG: HlyD family efflux transporter periplasmic adaptor subunit [bacterium]